MLALAPCIGTDQMGPKRFGDLGKLAFTTGNIAQDEGAAMAEWAFSQGWTRAGIAKDNVIVYFQNIADSFATRFEELGGEVVARQEWVNVRRRKPQLGFAVQNSCSPSHRSSHGSR